MTCQSGDARRPEMPLTAPIADPSSLPERKWVSNSPRKKRPQLPRLELGEAEQEFWGKMAVCTKS